MCCDAATAPGGCYNADRGCATGGICVTTSDRARPWSRVDAFILAGGRSERMGRDKARLLVGGAPRAAVLASRIAPAVASVRVVCKRGTAFDDCGIESVYDANGEWALVHGLAAALAAPGAEWRWLLACDMPGVDLTVLAALWEEAQAAGKPGCAPRLPGRSAPEPLPSLWHRDLLVQVRPEWGQAAHAWVRAAGLAIWEVPAGAESTFANINTPAEWEAYLASGMGGTA